MDQTLAQLVQSNMAFGGGTSLLKGDGVGDCRRGHDRVLLFAEITSTSWRLCLDDGFDGGEGRRGRRRSLMRDAARIEVEMPPGSAVLFGKAQPKNNGWVHNASTSTSSHHTLPHDHDTEPSPLYPASLLIFSSASLPRIFMSNGRTKGVSHTPSTILKRYAIRQAVSSVHLSKSIRGLS